MELDKIENYYNLTNLEVKSCLKDVSKNLSIPINEVIDILENLIDSLSENLSSLSFDIIQEYLFKKLNLTEIINLCSINKKNYNWCLNNDLFWKKYLKEHYSIVKKPNQYNSWFSFLKSLMKKNEPYDIYEIRKKKVKTKKKVKKERQKVNLIKKKSKYLYIDFNVEILANGDVIVKYDKIRYKFRPKYKFIFGYRYSGEMYSEEIFVLVDSYHKAHYYRINEIDRKSIEEIQVPENLKNKYIVEITRNKNDSWILTYNSTYTLGENIKTITNFKMMSEDGLIYLDHEGNLWNLNAYNQFKLLNFPQKAIYITVNSDDYYHNVYLILDSNGELWLMNNYGKLWFMDNYEFYKINKWASYDLYGNPDRIVEDIKIKAISNYTSISYTREFNYGIMVVTENDDIMILYRFSNLGAMYHDLQIKLPQNKEFVKIKDGYIYMK